MLHLLVGKSGSHLQRIDSPEWLHSAQHALRFEPYRCTQSLTQHEVFFAEGFLYALRFGLGLGPVSARPKKSEGNSKRPKAPRRFVAEREAMAAATKRHAAFGRLLRSALFFFLLEKHGHRATVDKKQPSTMEVGERKLCQRIIDCTRPKNGGG